MTRLLLCLSLGFAHGLLPAQESWQAALGRMPLLAGAAQLNQTNCVGLLLRSFQSNEVVKALIFMPGATDEIYLFRRVHANLTNASPSLLDALNALAAQTQIRATFRPPLLLLRTDEDPIEPLIDIEHLPTAERLKRAHFVPRVCYEDRDWDYVQPVLRWTLKLDVRPWRDRPQSWHFYRHSIAAWDLTGWEALEAVALAGKSRFAVDRKKVIFSTDTRVLARPKLDDHPPPH
jgi:hypothetical protein